MTNNHPTDTQDELAVLTAWQALPRLQPPAALDARILAAARQAAAAPAPQSRNGTAPRPRWPALWASAAVLAVALGLNWQLREQHPAATAPPALPAPPPAAPPEMGIDADRGEAPATTSVGPAAAGEQAHAIAAERARNVTTTATAAAPSRATAAPEARARPAQARPAAPSPAAQQAPPSSEPAAAARVKVEEAITPQSAPLAETEVAGSHAISPNTLEVAPPNPPVTPRPAQPNGESSGSLASAQTPEVALARIRALLAAGSTDEARAAAQRFVIDYPDASLPEDLVWLAAPR